MTPAVTSDGLERFSREYLLHHRVCPVAMLRPGVLRLAAAPDALLESALEDLRFISGYQIEVEQTAWEEVERLIERREVGSAREVEVQGAWESNRVDADVRDLALQPPVIRFVNLLVADAFEAGASDIHLESTRDGLSTRIRLDGVLVPALDCPREYQQAVVSRVKLLAEMDIAEKRRPQDGRIRVRLDRRELDIRVATAPTLHGESVVLRLLDQGGRPVDLSDLGMPSAILSEISRLVQRPHGLFVVTGPTGSGKTTTLYAALQKRNRIGEKIITVEDPVEYYLAGVTQVPVHKQGGVTFGSALRSILRQDPDVIMIGEMRDAETAQVAVQAAMTGHFVLSTLHTNDAASAIPRLTDLGVPTYLIAATLEGVVAQRLVRQICARCRTQHQPPAELLKRICGTEMAATQFYRGIGCDFCRGTGFRGRTAVFELMPMTDEMREAINRGAPKSVLTSILLESGASRLESEAWSKVQTGITTVEEVARVIHG
jgi:general secretion pathway protein E